MNGNSVWILGIIGGLMWWIDSKALKSEKRASLIYLGLLGLSGSISLILVFYPEMPGPTQWIDALYKPLGKLIQP
ncbi:hypothetical protein [Paenibacillus radicis (ex Xue et al. 2023)]|uniref:Uncharacterized protein n=1 Tax=Paenibacillus radicis (ex Xue et al. 2023) TaxID=2972489 RepID=A0ABT1YMB4_9BACL|nr:hypothetical protein [Paenibacillus radicis (ex Xue et al. 2023)]MCR8634316.1 hypothetical protein [Paenibacillus radicis (ex Xue et al. 2023)]